MPEKRKNHLINIHVGTIPRSGGSLICRLFDGHPDIASYPVEVPFPTKNDIAPFIEHTTGYPYYIPRIESPMNLDVFKLLGIPKKKVEPVHKWGKEQSDPMGVRKNYLEKAYYDTVKTSFDHKKFIQKFSILIKDSINFKDLWNSRHKAYFNAWENNRYAGSMKYVVTHASSGLYLSDFNRYFEEFKKSFFITSLRNVFGYIASEKTRLARRYYGSRRFPRFKMPNYLVKKFDDYDLSAYISAWMSSVTRMVILQEKFGVSDRFIVYRYENLIEDPENVMKTLCYIIGIDYNPCLLVPTIGGLPWSGNSHQGKQVGINKNLAENFREVLTENEIAEIEKSAGQLNKKISQLQGTPTNLREIPKNLLYDYKFQKKYFDDEEKIALYGALANSRNRRSQIKVPSKMSIIAVIYSFLIRLIHIPRMVKLRLLPGWGRQNYT